MKKLLTILGSVFLTASSTAMVSNVVSCVWPSEAIVNALKNNAIEVLKKQDYEFYEVKDGNVEIKPSSKFSDDEKLKLVKLTVNEFNAAKKYFEETLKVALPKEGENEWLKYTKLDKEKNSSGVSDELSDVKEIPESDKENAKKVSLRDKILGLLGDNVTTAQFQAAVAQMAIAKNNIGLIKDVKLDDQKEDEKKLAKLLKDMDEYLAKGLFIPAFKVVKLGKVRSEGGSKIKIKFDKNLVNYLTRGNKTKDLFKDSGLKYNNKEISSLTGDEEKNFLEALNKEDKERFYNYGDLGGKK